MVRFCVWAKLLKYVFKNLEAAGLIDGLNYVHLVTLSNEECKLAYGSQVTENMLCVEGNYNEGTCKVNKENRYIWYLNSFLFLTGRSW